MEEADVQVIAGRVWHEEDYPPKRRARWYATVRESLTDRGLKAPIVYPGSVPAKCRECDVTIAVGPRQQEQIRMFAGAPFIYLCLLCLETLADDDVQVVVSGLGNPDDPNHGRVDPLRG